MSRTLRKTTLTVQVTGKGALEKGVRPVGIGEVGSPTTAEAFTNREQPRIVDMTPAGYEGERVGHWMQTFTGKCYYPRDPRPEDVSIRDIAHALAMLCRYTGHTRKFYSVAEHSVHVSYLVPEDLALRALMHDAAEAYCGDVGKPLKVDLPAYNVVEHLNLKVICERFGLPVEEHPLIKQADVDMLHNEYAALMHTPKKRWMWGGVLRPGVVIHGWLPKVGEEMFLRRFIELGGHINVRV